ncbi:MAG: C45 family autoproteolytic acyltransferase/hydrolase [Candidatus Freyarchaeota archaeon]
MRKVGILALFVAAIFLGTLVIGASPVFTSPWSPSNASMYMIVSLGNQAGANQNSNMERGIHGSHWKTIRTYEKGCLKQDTTTGELLLHVRGTPYEMGYQHGMLLSDEITDLSSGFLTPVCMEIGGGYDLEHFQIGYEIMREIAYTALVPFIKAYTPQYWAEMEGMADALSDAGTPVTFGDLLLINTFLDITYYLESISSDYSCSYFAAWGNATHKGKLIHGGNTDFQSYNVAPNATIFIVQEPEPDPTIPGYTPGFPFLSVGWVGVIGTLSGMNIEGISVGDTTSWTTEMTIAGVPYFFLVRSVIQYADSIDAALWIFENTPKTAGFTHVVSDAKIPEAKVIEISAENVAIRSVNPCQPAPPQTIHTSNHYECEEMIPGQAEAYGIPWNPNWSVCVWLDFVRQRDRRVDRYNQLLNKYYGELTVSKAIRILRDRYDLFQERYLNYSEYGNTINALGPRTQVTGPIEQYYGIVRPIIKQTCTIYSWVFVPEDLQAWMASGEYPAPKGRYAHLDFGKELGLKKCQPSARQPYTELIGEGPSQVKVVHVFGGPYTRGFQFGTLYADEINYLTQIVYSILPEDTWQQLASAWGYFVPLEFKLEMAGIAAGCKAQGYNDITYEDILVINSFVDMGYWLEVHGGELTSQGGAQKLGCTALLATGPATVDGKTITGTTIDYMAEATPAMTLVDVTPTIGYRVVYYSGAGCLGLNGMNEKGLAQVEQSIGGPDQDFGMPAMIQSRMILQYMDDIYDAKTFMEASLSTIHPFLGTNYESHVQCIEVSDSQRNIMVMELDPAQMCTVINPDNGFDNQPPEWVEPHTYVGQGPGWLSRQGIFCCHEMKQYQFDPNDWSDEKMFCMSEQANASWGEINITKVLQFTKNDTIYDLNQVGSIFMVPSEGAIYVLRGPAKYGEYALYQIPVAEAKVAEGYGFIRIDGELHEGDAALYKTGNTFTLIVCGYETVWNIEGVAHLGYTDIYRCSNGSDTLLIKVISVPKPGVVIAHGKGILFVGRTCN